MKNTIDKYYYTSPIGLIEFSILDNALVSLKFTDKKEDFKKDTLFSKEIKKQLKEYFSLDRKVFDIEYKTDLTPFQKKVSDEIIKIPYGKILTYSDIAHKIGNKNASRAVGLALKTNPILIIIPCHRVVAKNGLGGYVSGLEKKKYLLNLEKNI